MKEHNPAAFPFSADERAWHGANEAQLGLRLRDYFAAAALNPCMNAAIEATKASGDNHLSEESLAVNAYRIADAMIAERSKQQTT